MPDPSDYPTDDDKRCTLFDKPKKFCLRCSEFHTADEWSDGCERYMGAAPIRQCKTCGGYHPHDAWGRNCMPEPNWNRSDLPSPQVIQDSLPDIMNPLTGRPIDSKRALRAEYRRAGVEEVGDQKVKTKDDRYAPVEKEVQAEVKKQMEIWKSDNLSNDQLANYLRSPAPVEGGFSVQ